MEAEIQETMVTGKAHRHAHLIMVPGQEEAEESKVSKIFLIVVKEKPIVVRRLVFFIMNPNESFLFNKSAFFNICRDFFCKWWREVIYIEASHVFVVAYQMGVLLFGENNETSIFTVLCDS